MSQGLQHKPRSLILSPRSPKLHNAKDSNQIVQVSLKFLWFMLIIKCLQKKKKSSSEKSKNGKKINAQMRKDENGMKCKC